MATVLAAVATILVDRIISIVVMDLEVVTDLAPAQAIAAPISEVKVALNIIIFEVDERFKLHHRQPQLVEKASNFDVAIIY